jgi:hypothetical protein
MMKHDKLMQGFKAGEMQVISVDCKGKSMNVDYEKIARHHGYWVVDSILWPNMCWWDDNRGNISRYYNSRGEAWKACCEENNLLEK